MSANRLGAINKHLVDSKVNLEITSSRSTISAKAVLDTRRRINVLDSYISYLDTGVGDNVVLFLHGNPTAAYLWRNVIPHVSPIARCVAPDLIGMGHSGKPDITYRYVDHYRYLSTWIDQMAFPGKITIVCHDWGSGLGFHWCNQNRDKVRAIVHMESLVCPIPDWESFLEEDKSREIFRTLRSDAGEELILKNNIFVKKYLPGNILRILTNEEMAEYLAPYKDSDISRLPTLMWPREIPFISDGPQDVVDIVVDYTEWLCVDGIIPKLFIDVDPGYFSSGIRLLVTDWQNQQTVTVKGLHFPQEDSPHEIGQAIRKFLEGLHQKS